MVNNPFCDPKANGIPTNKIGIKTKKGIKDYVGDNSKGYIDGIARSPDVLMALVGNNDKSAWNTHPATFPVTLVEQIILMLCSPDGVVLDPFMGSGTTAIAAMEHKRKYVGFEKEKEFVDIIHRRIAERQYKIDYQDFFDAVGNVIQR